MSSPFELVAAPLAGQPIGKSLPEPQRVVEKAPEPAPVVSPFRPVAAEPVEVPATQRVAPMAPMPSVGEVRFDLADSLKAVPAEVLGFSAQHLPSGIECRVPQNKVRPGFFPGTGMVALRDVVSSLPAAYRSVFANAKADYELAIPFEDTAAPAAVVPEPAPAPFALRLPWSPLQSSNPWPPSLW